MDTVIVGIDLGTTKSAIGYCKKDSDGKLRPKILCPSDGHNSIPSVVLVDADGNKFV